MPRHRGGSQSPSSLLTSTVLSPFLHCSAYQESTQTSWFTCEICDCLTLSWLECTVKQLGLRSPGSADPPDSLLLSPFDSARAWRARAYSQPDVRAVPEWSESFRRFRAGM